jgi:putative endonuclease
MTRRTNGPADPGRLIAHGFGHRAEWAATLLLAGKGYWPLARNYVVRGGEIDLIARRGRTVIFAEVKARPRMDEALTAISGAKRQRIERAARVWLTRNPWAADCVLRGDGVFVAPYRWPQHIENAFPLDLI